jgi:hypothetical protein
MSKPSHPFWGLMVSAAILVLLLELSPYAMSRVVRGHPFSRGELKQELRTPHGEHFPAALDEVRAGDRGPRNRGHHVLHPYLGFVAAPRAGFNRFGFPGDDPILEAADDEINICITGGSVALQLFRFSRERMVEHLKSEPSLAGKKLNVVVVALGGFKQPQQLIALSYLLALSAHYDVVINLDGFNEVALPYGDNLPFGVFPTFPRHWSSLRAE